jgi:2'-5' RNA ligase
MTVKADVQRPWRCFLAVPIPSALRLSLADAVATLRLDPKVEAEWRFADADAWHLTLAFLGVTPVDAVEPLVEAVAGAVADLEPFEVATGGLGGFPSPRNARVLWYGVSDPERRLQDLARRLQGAARLDDGAPFRPHVTLARVRGRHGVDAQALLAAQVPVGSVPVRGVMLFRSHVGRGPARYEVLAEMPMGVPRDARLRASAGFGAGR